MKTRITLSELKQINPYQYGKIIQALNRNRVKTTKVKIEFSKDILEKYILDNIRK
jgi:hypothetical protein